MSDYSDLDGAVLLGTASPTAAQKQMPLADHFGFGLVTQLPAWLFVRVIYVRVSNCPLERAPKVLTMRCPPRSMSIALEVSGARISPSEVAFLTLRRDRVDEESAEVTYVCTQSFRTSGSIAFEFCVKDEVLLRGNLERSEPSVDIPADGSACESVSTQRKSNEFGWSMDCASKVGSKGCVFLKDRHMSPPTVEVCMVARYCCSPVILTENVILMIRRKSVRRNLCTLDAIPEGDESEKSRNSLALIRSENNAFPNFTEKGATGLGAFYDGNGFSSEDGDLSWFNAGVRVGLGVGLGICLGVGIGVGVMVRSYQVTTKTLRRGFF